jgi:glycosyltransferase involved in cell wall biosynthesis
MKVSLITVSFNSAGTIKDTIESVRSQDYDDIEYIIVDGNSKDGTVDVIRSHEAEIDRWISEPDTGIYDAMNKAIKMATGEVVGILNSDDFYSSANIVSQVAEAFNDPNIDAVFGDLVFVDPNNLKKVVRTYSTFFVRRRYYDQIGMFKTDYKIAADYELLIRFLYVHKLKYKYLPINMVTMRRGGVSSKGIMSNFILNDEIIRGCRENGIQTSAFKVYPKYFIKLFELFN